MAADDAEEQAMLRLARQWKAGHLGAVHPSVGRLFNRSLFIAGEDPVPFARSTDVLKPSVIELIRTEHLCAPHVQIGVDMDAEIDARRLDGPVNAVARAGART
jgi:hypothetical protein